MVMLRALLLATLGVFACGAILAATIVIIVHGAATGAPLERGDWAGAAVFGGLSAVVIVISILAARRAWRGGEAANAASRWVARIAPVLAAGGVVLGIVVGLGLSRGRVQGERESDRGDCESVLGAPLDEERLAPCQPLARACRHSASAAGPATAREQEEELDRWPAKLRMPSSRGSRLAKLCLIDRLRERGLFPPR